METVDTPMLQLRGISKSFGSVRALVDVDFDVRAGEVVALVGDNGAGKSTLIKCVAGIHPVDSGEILFDGGPAHIHGPKGAAALGIEVVYQDLALCDNLDVVQNMFLGRELHDALQTLREPEMEEETEKTMAALGVTTLRSVRQRVATLSGGQRQAVAVARAVMWNSRVLILDEPTAALGVVQSTQVLALVERLDNLIIQAAGTATIAFGVVFVLLIGEIDLSVGFVSGLAGITAAEMQLSGSSHQFPGLAAILMAMLVGVAIGAFQGSFVSFLGMPSFSSRRPAASPGRVSSSESCPRA